MTTPNVEAVKLDELNCWRIRHGQAELLVAQQGAHILSYQIGRRAAADLAQRRGRVQDRQEHPRRRAGVLAVVR